MKKTQEIKALFKSLPLQSQRELLEDLLMVQELQGKVLQEAEQEVIAKRNKKPCPGCSSTRVHKRGKQKGVQMYRCNDCGKWYSETTGTPLYDIKLKSKWQSYLNCMEQGMPIKAIAKELGISIQTSFDWRHKILSSLEQFTPTELSEEVECDELELALSNKGSKSLERKPRKRGTVFKRKALLAEDHVDKNDNTIHLQKVNNVHAQLRTFLRPFNGVSSKYLQNYLNWYAYVDKIRNSKTTIKQWCVTMLLTDQAYQLFELFKQNAVLIRT